MSARPVNSVRFVQQGDRVLVIWAGKLAGDLEAASALEMARALRAVAQRAAEWGGAQRIADDQAILIRRGIPIGLSDHPAIQREAIKEAAWGRSRGVGGIPTGERVGVPIIKRGKPS